MDNLNDIIVGISTAYQEGAISIIRLSGKGCINLVNQIFKGKDLNKVLSHTIHYGYIMDNEEVVDEVLVSVFLAPKTYTKEDVVEINCHGGIFVTNKIYEIILTKGARSASRGEFTKRAFLNGRIDLTEAEAVMDMIRAESNSSVRLATKGLCGDIKRCVTNLRKKLIDIIAVINVNIDYPEYDDVQMLTTTEILPNIESIYNEIDNLLTNSKSAKYLKNGLDTAIIGLPNVGKSSLLNALIEDEKAIVTSIPGTTRDLVEAKINLGNITLNLIDTAGIRETEDIVEQIGVNKSVEALNKAEFILMVLDGSKNLSKEDEALLSLIKDKKHLTVINKSDLGLVLDPKMFINSIVITTSSQEDLDRLKQLITSIVEVEKLDNKDITLISNARQIEKLSLAKTALEEALNEIKDQLYIDFIELHLRSAWMYLGEIIGETSTEDLLDELFSKFCLGK